MKNGAATKKRSIDQYGITARGTKGMNASQEKAATPRSDRKEVSQFVKLYTRRNHKLVTSAVSIFAPSATRLIAVVLEIR
jgi:hypothetical protein